MLLIKIILEIALVLVFGAVLVSATNILVEAFEKISRYTKVSKFGITALVMALATSLPEMMVGIMSAIEGRPSLSLGNVLGSNISNLSLVVGGAAIVGGGLKIMGDFLRKDLAVGGFVGSLPLVMLLDGKLSRIDGVILLVVYVIFVRTIVFERPVNMIDEEGVEVEPVYARFFAFFRRRALRHSLAQLLLGLLLLTGSAYALVEIAQVVAKDLNLPLLFIGLFLVAVGTTLPELSFAVRAIKERQAAMILGNLLGSLVANSSVVLGIVAIISPITPNGGIKPYLIGTLGYITVFVLFFLFAMSKKILTRKEGVVLVLVYLLVMGIEVWQ